MREKYTAGRPDLSDLSDLRVILESYDILCAIFAVTADFEGSTGISVFNPFLWLLCAPTVDVVLLAHFLV